MFSILHTKVLTISHVFFKAIISIAALLFTLNANATPCSFNTAEYSDELRKLSSVVSVDVLIGNNRKWMKNSFRILADKTDNIKSQFKHKFKATVSVNYQFGNCRYSGKVRQSGDWKDHIKVIDRSKVVQSLDISLEDGAIASIVDFKLLIPETREGHNEIIGTQLFRALGFIAPRTSIMTASVNKTTASYLFQENLAKELLEDSRRREGPIFEGDESLLWSYKDYENFELEQVSGARLINDKWSARGSASLNMSMNAFFTIQSAYLDYAADADTRVMMEINPESSKDAFPKYHALLYALGGSHAMRPHNRKFYWNSFESLFEPVYYDGNLTFIPPGTAYLLPKDIDLLVEQARDVDFKSLYSGLNEFTSDEQQARFSSLAKMSHRAGSRFFSQTIDTVMTNLKKLEKLSLTSTTPQFSEPLDSTRLLVQKSSRLQVDQNLLELVNPASKNSYKVKCTLRHLCTEMNLTQESMSALLSKQNIDGHRSVLISNVSDISDHEPISVTNTPAGQITHSMSSKVILKKDNLHISLVQNDPSDWFLLDTMDLSDYTIEFRGKNDKNTIHTNEQRFNELGLTGCLNIYNSTLQGIKVIAKGGFCEDSVNIVSSTGQMRKIRIIDAYSDALDIDFSDLSIQSVYVIKAGNDCFDLSGGTYLIGVLNTSLCGDKGLSVGEASYLEVQEATVMDSTIAVSSKDSSKTNIEDLSTKNVSICLEAFQKKQEFYGAIINIDEYNCKSGDENIDRNSIVRTGRLQNEL